MCWHSYASNSDPKGDNATYHMVQVEVARGLRRVCNVMRDPKGFGQAFHLHDKYTHCYFCSVRWLHTHAQAHTITAGIQMNYSDA